MNEFDAELCVAAGDQLGECPVWDPIRQELLWTDIHGRRLHRLADGSSDPITLELDRRLASFAVTDVGLLIAAFDTGLGLLDRDDGSVEWLGDVEADRPYTRCNDGRPDRNGNFVFGTMVEVDSAEVDSAEVDSAEVDSAEAGDEGGHSVQRVGGFYHWHAGRGLTSLHRSARVANGLSFDLDGLSVHYADSARGDLWRARYHPQHALFIEDEPFVAAGVIPGVPDGADMDSEGRLWNARWGASGVACLDHDGALVSWVHVGAPQVSACVFGGPGLDRLYITTARQGMDSDDPAYDTSGSLWVVEPGAVGVAATPVATGRA